MQPIKVENEHGETIEIKWDADRNIHVRHSDIDKERFGQLHEYSKRVRVPGLRRTLKEKGIDTSDPNVQAMAGRLGGYILIDGEQFDINAKEVALIFEAVKQNGGIVPNWSAL
jgi:hypothetical protein